MTSRRFRLTRVGQVGRYAARRLAGIWLDHNYHVDQADLQGNVLAGYGNTFRHGLYLFLQVDDADRGRNWVASIVPEITTAVPWPKRVRPQATFNVAFTCDGLAALGVPEPLLGTFPKDFRNGMAHDKQHSESLGDVNVNDPSRWEAGLGPGDTQVLVTIFAREKAELDRRREELLEQLRTSESGLSVTHEQVTRLLPHGGKALVAREHFGFADGFSQPAIRGNAGPDDRRGGGTPARFGGWKGVAPGEFVLGYPEEDGTLAKRPDPPLRQSGTYTVVRKLYQDVGAFTKYVRELSEGCSSKEEHIAAMIVGRWRDGTPVEVAPERPNAMLSADRGLFGSINDFRYKGDQEGLRCPLGSHVRRANPRDSFGWRGSLTKRHRIIRRSMPYGPPPADPAVDDDVDRGLMFVCHQSSITRQFEVVQSQWLNDGDAFWLGEEKDLLTMGGQGEVESGVEALPEMTMPGRPPTFLPRPTTSFVRMRGGGYYFTPGIRALETIGAGAWV
jgi:Dyp-type peroxidase family